MLARAGLDRSQRQSKRQAAPFSKGNFSINPGILRDGASSYPWNSRESWPGTAISVSPPPGLIEKLRL